MFLLIGVVVALLALPALAYAVWQKMAPPPDADKPADGWRSMTCWLATAANMLAGAGYGDGTTVQQRAVDIYNELFAYYGNQGGWTDTAITWWLNSGNNKWKGSNPYTVVTFYGQKSPRTPWANPNGAQFIGNELRRCEMVGLALTGPNHDITAWGDSGGAGNLTANPTQVIVTDSDRDTGGDVQSYTYDPYNNGWYINYDADHAYILGVYTLCPTDKLSGQSTQKVVGSLTLNQVPPMYGWAATDLHYKVYTDVDILTYKTTIDWPAAKPPTIVEIVKDGKRVGLMVDWDLSGNPVPQLRRVTITTEFVLPSWNSISYDDVYFTYPGLGSPFPGFMWEMYTPQVPDTSVPNICGGYVVGSFDLFADPNGQNLIGQYRFLHEYDYFQDPELHQFQLIPTELEQVAYVGNLCFGHSYGFLDPDFLWAFEDWMTCLPGIVRLSEGIGFTLNWDGRLRYPARDLAPAPKTYNLTVHSTAGGSVTNPGEGTFTYDEGTVVNLVATPGAGYRFVNWTGDVDTIANVNARNTTITMNGDYSIRANFAAGAVRYDLTITSTAGGNVTAPGEGAFTYDAGAVVSLVATPDSGYQFVNWTGDVDAIADVEDPTTITMNGNYSIRANFEEVAPPPGGGCGMATAADGAPIALVSVGLLVAWAMKRRSTGV